MVVSIDEKSISLIKQILKEQNKEAVRIAKTGIGWGGLQFEIVLDEQKPDDDVVIDNGIKIVADKSFSFFFTSAMITHKDGIFGPRFKLVNKEWLYSTFAISTYDTDYIPVKNKDIDNVVESLVKERYKIID